MDPNAIAEDLLKARYEFLNTATVAMMTWWVSSVAFSAALISQVWDKRIRINTKATAWWLASLGTALFLSIIVFGIGSFVYIGLLSKDTGNLISTVLKPVTYKPLLEFACIRFSIITGTSSFILALFAWWALSYSILQRIAKSQVRQDAGHEGAEHP